MSRPSAFAMRVLPIVALLSLSVAGTATAQPSGPVGYTEAIQHPVGASVRLPGSVESRTAGIVASEAAGLVVELAVQPGDRVARGDTIVRLRDRYYRLDLAAAEGQLREAQARLELAENNLRRSRDLFEDEVVSKETLDDSFSEFTAWQGRVDETSARIDQIKDSVDRSVVRAPYAGVVVEKLTELGQWIERGASVVEMVSLDALEIRVEVPERYYDQLREGTSVEVGFGALPGYVITGKIRSVIPKADPQARSFPVKVTFVDRDGRVGVGMLSEVALPVGEPVEELIVPKDGLVSQGGITMVYRISPEGAVEPLPVETGQGAGAWIVVRGPLAPGDRVVTRGNERLMPGQAVEATPVEYPLQ